MADNSKVCCPCEDQFKGDPGPQGLPGPAGEDAPQITDFSVDPSYNTAGQVATIKLSITFDKLNKWGAGGLTTNAVPLPEGPAGTPGAPGQKGASLVKLDFYETDASSTMGYSISTFSDGTTYTGASFLWPHAAITIALDNTGDVKFSGNGSLANPLHGDVPALADKADKTDLANKMNIAGDNAKLAAADDATADLTLATADGLGTLSQSAFISDNSIAVQSDLSGFIKTVNTDGITVIGDGTDTPLSSPLMKPDGSNQTAGFIKTVKTDGMTVEGDGVNTPLSSPLMKVDGSNSTAGFIKTVRTDGKTITGDGVNTYLTAPFQKPAVDGTTVIGDGTSSAPLSATGIGLMKADGSNASLPVAQDLDDAQAVFVNSSGQTMETDSADQVIQHWGVAKVAQLPKPDGKTIIQNSNGTWSSTTGTPINGITSVVVDNTGDVDFGQTNGTSDAPLKGLIPALVNKANASELTKKLDITGDNIQLAHQTDGQIIGLYNDGKGNKVFSTRSVQDTGEMTVSQIGRKDGANFTLPQSANGTDPIVLAGDAGLSYVKQSDFIAGANIATKADIDGIIRTVKSDGTTITGDGVNTPLTATGAGLQKVDGSNAAWPQTTLGNTYFYGQNTKGVNSLITNNQAAAALSDIKQTGSYPLMLATGTNSLIPKYATDGYVVQTNTTSDPSLRYSALAVSSIAVKSDIAGFIKSVKTDGATITGDGVSAPLTATGMKTDASNASLNQGTASPTTFVSHIQGTPGWVSTPASLVNISSLNNDAGFQTAGNVQASINSVISSGLMKADGSNSAIPVNNGYGVFSLFGYESKYGEGTVNFPKNSISVSFFTNDAGYQTASQVKAAIPAKVSAFTNDAGYITETNPYPLNAQFITITTGKGQTSAQSVGSSPVAFTGTPKGTIYFKYTNAPFGTVYYGTTSDCSDGSQGIGTTGSFYYNLSAYSNYYITGSNSGSSPISFYIGWNNVLQDIKLIISMSDKTTITSNGLLSLINS